jgi:Aldehyde dehydrogenase family
MSPVAKHSVQLEDQSLWLDQGIINGKAVEAKSGKRFDVEDPSTRKVIGSAPEMDADDCRDAIAAALTAFSSFKKTTARERARMLRAYNDVIMAAKDDLATIIVAENGKPSKSHCSSISQHYADGCHTNRERGRGRGHLFLQLLGMVRRGGRESIRVDDPFCKCAKSHYHRQAAYWSRGLAVPVECELRRASYLPEVLD